MAEQFLVQKKICEEKLFVPKKYDHTKIFGPKKGSIQKFWDQNCFVLKIYWDKKFGHTFSGRKKINVKKKKLIKRNFVGA